MKNKLVFVFVLTLLLIVVLGCSSLNPLAEKGNSPSSSNKGVADRAIDTALGGETTGVPECDEVMDMIAAEANNPDDGYIVKATKALFLNKVKESIKTSIDENKNKNGGTDLAKTCADYKRQLEKFRTDEQKKTK